MMRDDMGTLGLRISVKPNAPIHTHKIQNNKNDENTKSQKYKYKTHKYEYKYNPNNNRTIHHTFNDLIIPHENTLQVLQQNTFSMPSKPTPPSMHRHTSTSKDSPSSIHTTNTNRQDYNMKASTTTDSLPNSEPNIRTSPSQSPDNPQHFLPHPNTQCPNEHDNNFLGEKFHLKIISENINGTSFNAANIEKFIVVMNLADKENADVILLQETHAFEEDDHLLRLYGHKYWWTSSGGNGRSRGVTTGLRKTRFNKPSWTDFAKDNVGRWLSGTVKDKSGILYQISNFYLPHFIQGLTLAEFNKKVPKDNDAIQILGGDFNTDSRKPAFEWTRKWGDGRGIFFVNNEIPTWRNKSIIDHIGLDTRLIDCENELCVLPGNGLDHSIVLCKSFHSTKSKLAFPFRRIDDRYTSSPLLHKETLERIGKWDESADPMEYLMNFTATARDIIISNSGVIENEADREELSTLIRCLRIRPSDLTQKDTAFTSVKEIVDIIKETKGSKKLKRKRWKSLVRTAIAKFRKDYGTPIAHLIRDRNTKLKRPRMAKNY
jgi:hypothetical protein